MTSGPPEQRRYPRVDLDLRVAYQANGSDHTGGRLRNVGEGGVSLASDVSHGAGTLISLRFTLASGWVIVAEGLVVIASRDKLNGEFHHGIRFSAISEEDQRAIGEFAIDRISSL